MNTMKAYRGLAIILGLFLIGYAGLYYCGWNAIFDLIDYARCNWSCAEKTEIVWGIFRLMLMLELFIGVGTWLFIFGIVRP